MWSWAQYACYGLMFLLALLASISDLRYGLISNRHIRQGLECVVLLHLIILAAVGECVALPSPPGPGVGPMVISVVINGAFGLAVSLILYFAGLWSAGDAKLAIVMAFGQPAWVAVGGPIPWAPFTVLLGNALIAVVIFVVFEVMVRGFPLLVRRVKASIVAHEWPWSRDEVISALRVALAVTALATALGPLRQWLGSRFGATISGGTFLALIVLYMLYKPLARLARRRWGVVGSFALFGLSAGYSLWSGGAAGAIEVGRSMLVGLSVVAVRGVLSASSRSFDTRSVSREELRPGMVLSIPYLAVLEEEERWKEAFAPMVGSLRGMRLDQVLIDNLLEWQAHNAPEEPFVIRTPLPFAPALAAGVVLTAVFGRLIFLFERPIG